MEIPTQQFMLQISENQKYLVEPYGWNIGRNKWRVWFVTILPPIVSQIWASQEARFRGKKWKGPKITPENDYLLTIEVPNFTNEIEEYDSFEEAVLSTGVTLEEFKEKAIIF